MRLETGRAASTRAEKAERGSEGWIVGRGAVVVVVVVVAVCGGGRLFAGAEVERRFRFLEVRRPSSRPGRGLRRVVV